MPSAAPATGDKVLAVARLGTVPVKGTRWRPSGALSVDHDGVPGDRRFFVVDPDGALVRTSRTPRLAQIAAELDGEGEALELAFPDGSRVTAPVRLGPAATTHNYEGRAIPGRLVEGPFAAAVSEFLGRPVALLARDRGVVGGDDAPVTLMLEETVAALAPALGGVAPDERRFRMNIVLAGAEAWTEHGWTGAELEIGASRLRVLDPVPRCVVTTRDPDTGRRDVPALAALAKLRGRDDVTLGVWCEVVRPGIVQRGDPVTVRA